MTPSCPHTHSPHSLFPVCKMRAELKVSGWLLPCPLYHMTQWGSGYPRKVKARPPLPAPGSSARSSSPHPHCPRGGKESTESEEGLSAVSRSKDYSNRGRKKQIGLAVIPASLQE